MNPFFLFSFLILMSSQNLLAKKSTVYLVRHAEVSYRDGNFDPHLTEAGKERALALRELLKEKGVSQVLATSYKRTQETAQPTADLMGIPVQIKNKAEQIVAEILSLQHKAILVAGHSDSIPKILHLLGATEKELPEISHSAFNKLFIVKIKEREGSRNLQLELHSYGR